MDPTTPLSQPPIITPIVPGEKNHLLLGLIPVVLVLGVLIVIKSGVVDRLRNLLSKTPTQTAQQIQYTNKTLAGRITSVGTDSIEIKTDQTTYELTISADTQISAPAPSVPYAFRTPPPAATVKPSLSDLKTGQSVSVEAGIDPKNPDSKTVAALTINVTPYVNFITGNVKAISGNSLEVESVRDDFSPIPVSEFKSKDYRVSVSNNTEITSEGKKISLSNLSAGQKVIIYADSDVTATNNLAALKIDTMSPSLN